MREALCEFAERVHQPFAGVPPHERRTQKYALRVLMHYAYKAWQWTLCIACVLWLANTRGEAIPSLKPPKWWS